MRPGLTLRAVPDPQALAMLAADLIAAQVRAKPELTMLVATGSTPMPTYAELGNRVQAGTLDLSRVTVVGLDEYLGLEPDDPRSLWDWTLRSVIGPLRIRRSVRFGASGDPGRACAEYDAQIAALGGIDLAILGLGPNGHLGFNEPPSAADAPTRVADLTPESLVSNRAYWGQDVPRRALTAGMTVILAARCALLLVSGEHKRGILHRVLEGPPTPEVPASLLGGPGVSVLADRAALGPEDAQPVSARLDSGPDGAS
ncbi:glucosamine-6-phosphate deaminase [Deinococcus sp.]|uniref:glucosamine-6-phosphate deaminase n=1 Tax=Deinococcus sp. TaxID=47478 RepID=UPI003C7B757E